MLPITGDQVDRLDQAAVGDHRIPENSRTLQMRRSELDRYLIELLDQDIWLQGVKHMLADPNLKNRPWPHYRNGDQVWV